MSPKATSAAIKSSRAPRKRKPAVRAARKGGPAPLLVKAQANYYQQFDADHSRAVPAEAYGGWQKGAIEIDLAKTALVVMHAWDCGAQADYPGWYRCVEYIPRAQRVCAEVFPGLLSAVRASPVKVLHVVGGGSYYQDRPGYQWAVKLAKPTAPGEMIAHDATVAALNAFKGRNVFVGAHNQADVGRGFVKMAFAPQAVPVGDEGVAENADQLSALCNAGGISHLVYVGFNINWCILMSPGGMMDMSRRGAMCSTIRQATTAVENRETARKGLEFEAALWRTSIAFGFVFDLKDFLRALRPKA